jgi:hypothetical protein
MADIQPVELVEKSNASDDLSPDAMMPVPDATERQCNEPWEHIFQCLNVGGSCEITITSAQIKGCKPTWKGKPNQFEPRLLAYQISADARPEIFKKYGFCIFPVQNGVYQLTKNNIYQSLDYSPVDIVNVNRDLSSSLLAIGDSESSFIDNLRHGGVFERPEFMNEAITHGPLLNGRHRCSFQMKLGDNFYSIKGVQYEVDSCFESQNKILLIEGKNESSPFDSFNVRQLYFPYRQIYETTKAKKEIICLFIHKCGDLMHIWKYHFDEPTRMDSIVLDGHHMFKFN